MTDRTPDPDNIPQRRTQHGRFDFDPRSADLDARACALRTRGLSYRQIADEIGCSVSSAHGAVQRGIASIRQEPAEELVAHELARLDLLQAEAFAILGTTHYAVSGGKLVEGPDGGPLLDEGPKLSAIGKLIQIQESRRKLLGLDQPAKLDLGSVAITLNGVDLDKLR